MRNFIKFVYLILRVSGFWIVLVLERCSPMLTEPNTTKTIRRQPSIPPVGRYALTEAAPRHGPFEFDCSLALEARVSKSVFDVVVGSSATAISEHSKRWRSMRVNGSPKDFPWTSWMDDSELNYLATLTPACGPPLSEVRHGGLARRAPLISIYFAREISKALLSHTHKT